MSEEINHTIVESVLEEEMKESYLSYSMSVIVGRALPDARDGLKPVHRRVLYAMHDMGMFHNKPFKKSARIVGETLGKYHPHGDTAVYDSLVRMAQDFSLRYPLIQGQGNMGSIDGDSQAAMRYTEARLNPLSEEMLEDIDKETVEFIPNFDGTLKEPAVLPSKVPNLLINGSSGIAVGMATNMPPHNVSETCDAIIKVLESPEISVQELMKIIPGPDFPTGGIICGVSEIRKAYETGRGKITVRSRIELEEEKNRVNIIVKEIPYMVNKSGLLEQIANAVKEKKILGVSNLRDESDREGMRIVIELKSGTNSDVVLNQLCAHTRMQETFSIINLALVQKQPRILGIRELIHEYLRHRKEIIRKRTGFDLRKAEDRAHILEGIMVALSHIDNIIAFLKQAQNITEARKGLIDNYRITEKQAQAILDMKLQKITSLEQQQVRQEYTDLSKKMEELKEILSSDQRIAEIIKKELEKLKKTYLDSRRTQITSEEPEVIEEEQLIRPQEVLITKTHKGYVKRIPLETYKEQKRGGRGVIGAEIKEQDFVEDVFTANTHDNMLFFTDKGKVHWLKVHHLPEAGRYAKGTPIINILGISRDEKISSYVAVKDFTEKGRFLTMVTAKGIVKKTPLETFSKPRKGGIRAVTLEEDDWLINTFITDGNKELLLASKKGMAIRFHEKDIRAMGRTAKGVIGMRLKKDDKVVGASVVQTEKQILTITEKGYGKRTEVKEYRSIHRGGRGVTNIKITEKNGKVISVKPVEETEQVVLISRQGIIIRVPVKGISLIGRATQGVRVMKLAEGDEVASSTLIKE